MLTDYKKIPIEEWSKGVIIKWDFDVEHPVFNSY